MDAQTKFGKILARLLVVNGAISIAGWIIFYIISPEIRELPFWFILFMITFASLGLLCGIALLIFSNRKYWLGGFVFYLLQVVSVQDVFNLQSGFLSVKMSWGSSVAIDLIALGLAVLCVVAYTKRP